VGWGRGEAEGEVARGEGRCGERSWEKLLEEEERCEGRGDAEGGDVNGAEGGDTFYTYVYTSMCLELPVSLRNFDLIAVERTIYHVPVRFSNRHKPVI
jgi:hypothetical protein